MFSFRQKKNQSSDFSNTSIEEIQLSTECHGLALKLRHVYHEMEKLLIVDQIRSEDPEASTLQDSVSLVQNIKSFLLEAKQEFMSFELLKEYRLLLEDANTLVNVKTMPLKYEVDDNLSVHDFYMNSMNKPSFLVKWNPKAKELVENINTFMQKYHAFTNSKSDEALAQPLASSNLSK